MARTNLNFIYTAASPGTIVAEDLHVGDDPQSVLLRIIEAANTGINIISSVDKYGNSVTPGTGLTTLGVDMDYVNLNILAGNGLTNNAGTIELGGLLTKHTTVDVNNKEFRISDTAGDNIVTFGKTFIDFIYSSDNGYGANAEWYAGYFYSYIWGGGFTSNIGQDSYAMHRYVVNNGHTNTWRELASIDGFIGYSNKQNFASGSAKGLFYDATGISLIAKNASDDSLHTVTIGAKGLRISNAGELKFDAYPGMREDGSTLKALYVDIDGNVKYGTVTVGETGASTWSELDDKPNSGEFIYNQSTTDQAASFRIDGTGQMLNLTLKGNNSGTNHERVYFNSTSYYLGRDVGNTSLFYRATGGHRFFDVDASVDRFVFGSIAGNFHIGDTTSQGSIYKLQVSGDTFLKGNLFINTSGRAIIPDAALQVSVLHNQPIYAQFIGSASSGGSNLGGFYFEDGSTATNHVRPQFRMRQYGSGSPIIRTQLQTQSTNTGLEFIVGDTSDAALTGTAIAYKFFNGTSEIMRMNNNGHMLVGTTSEYTATSLKLQVDGGIYSTKSVTNATVPAYGSGAAHGAIFSFNMSGAITNTNYHYGLYSSLSVSSASTFNSYRAAALYGVLSLANTNVSAGEVAAIQAHASMTGSTTGDMNGIFIRTQFVQSGTISNYRALYIGSPEGSGTVTNKYGVFQSSSTMKNYFAGNTLLGSSTDNGNMLQVTGTGNITTQLKIATNNPYDVSYGLVLNNLLIAGMAAGSPTHRLTMSGDTGPNSVIFTNSTGTVLTYLRSFGTAYASSIWGVPYAGGTNLFANSGHLFLYAHNKNIYLGTNITNYALEINTSNTIKATSLNDSTGIAKMVTTTNGVLSYQDIPTFTSQRFGFTGEDDATATSRNFNLNSGSQFKFTMDTSFVHWKSSEHKMYLVNGTNYLYEVDSPWRKNIILDTVNNWAELDMYDGAFELIGGLKSNSEFSKVRVGGTKVEIILPTTSNIFQINNLPLQSETNDQMMVWDSTSKKVGYRTIPTGGGGPSYTFANGLTDTSGTVKLGGNLSEDTTIIMGSYKFSLYNDSLNCVNFDFYSGGLYAEYFFDDGTNSSYTYHSASDYLAYYYGADGKRTYFQMDNDYFGVEIEKTANGTYLSKFYVDSTGINMDPNLGSFKIQTLNNLTAGTEKTLVWDATTKTVGYADVQPGISGSSAFYPYALTNVASVGAKAPRYTKVGNVVTVFALLAIEATATGAFSIEFELPILPAADFTTKSKLIGLANSETGESAIIQAKTGTKLGIFTSNASTTSEIEFTLTYQYSV